MWRRRSQELGPKGIRINSVSPGQVETELWLGDHGVAATIGAATNVDAATVRSQAMAGIATVIDGGLVKTL